MAQTESKTRIKPSEKIKEPSLFRVIYLNDNTTTMEFVVESLVEHFDYTPETAEQITIDIHEEGSAVVAVPNVAAGRVALLYGVISVNPACDAAVSPATGLFDAAAPYNPIYQVAV